MNHAAAAGGRGTDAPSGLAFNLLSTQRTKNFSCFSGLNCWSLLQRVFVTSSFFHMTLRQSNNLSVFPFFSCALEGCTFLILYRILVNLNQYEIGALFWREREKRAAKRL